MTSRIQKYRRNFFYKTVILLLLIFFSVLPFTSMGETGELTPPESKEFAIITTADIQSNIISFETEVKEDGEKKRVVVGGMDRIFYLSEKIRSETAGAILVSTGDDLMGIFFTLFKGVPEMKSMTMAGYDVVTPGNHEFDQGIDVYVNAASYADFPIICSNITTTDNELASIIEPYIIKNVNGLKVGFFGLMTPDLPRVASVGDEVQVKDVIDTAKEMVEILRGEGVDIVVALTHEGASMDRLVAREVPGIDIIVGGHSHEYVYETVTGPDDWETIIVQAGAGGERVGVLYFTFDGEKVIEPRWELVLLDDSVGADRKLKRFLKKYKRSFDRQLKKPIGESLVELDATTKVVRTGESVIGNVITDSWLEWYKEKGGGWDIAMINGGAIRSDRVYEAGPITYKELYSIYPFGDDVVGVMLSGEELLQILEISASALIVDNDSYDSEIRTSTGGFLQVGGMRVIYDVSKEPFRAEFDGKTLKKLISPGNRVVKVEVMEDGNWVPLDKNKDYSLLVNSWIAGGGDGYYIFNEILDKEDTTLKVVNLLLFYLEEKGPIDASIEGRITIEGGTVEY